MEEFLPRSGGDVFPKIEEPCDDALNVRVEDGNRLVECESHNGRSRIGPDSRQRAQEVEVAGNATAELRENCLRRAVQVARPGVVSKALPVLHDLLFICDGEGCDIGKSLHPSPKIRLNGGNSRLLEHEFGNQNGIWRWIRPPWQDPPMDAEPFLKRLVEISCSIF